MPAIPDYEGHIVAKPKHSIPALSTINHRTNVTFSEALVFVQNYKIVSTGEDRKICLQGGRLRRPVSNRVKYDYSVYCMPLFSTITHRTNVTLSEALVFVQNYKIVSTGEGRKICLQGDHLGRPVSNRVEDHYSVYCIPSFSTISSRTKAIFSGAPARVQAYKMI